MHLFMSSSSIKEEQNGMIKMTFQEDSTGDRSINNAETSLELYEHFSQFQDMTDVLHCQIHLPACL